MNKLAKVITEWRISKSFITPSSLDSEEERDLMLGKLMLVVTEISEAAEAVRHNDLENFKEELADSFIRLLDITGTMKIDIEKAVRDKMNVNRNRPKKHNKQTNL